jgi:Ala-tRNA(Pro) deacylase
MSLAKRVRWYLDHNHIDYDILHHPPAKTPLEAGLRARVPAGRVAKCVLLEDERGYVLAILPAACHLSFNAIDDLLNRQMELATEPEVDEVFSDCALGALPAIGSAYNVPMLVDDSLLRLPDVYFEGGDHEDLVHVGRDAFHKLMETALHGRIRRPN